MKIKIDNLETKQQVSLFKELFKNNLANHYINSLEELFYFIDKLEVFLDKFYLNHNLFWEKIVSLAFDYILSPKFNIVIDWKVIIPSFFNQKDFPISNNFNFASSLDERNKKFLNFLFLYSQKNKQVKLISPEVIESLVKIILEIDDFDYIEFESNRKDFCYCSSMRVCLNDILKNIESFNNQVLLLFSDLIYQPLFEETNNLFNNNTKGLIIHVIDKINNNLIVEEVTEDNYILTEKQIEPSIAILSTLLGILSNNYNKILYNMVIYNCSKLAKIKPQLLSNQYLFKF